MSVFDVARLIIYRCHERGLEVLMVRTDEEINADLAWKLPEAVLKGIRSKDGSTYIELDPMMIDDTVIRTIAIEADWHEIPSIRALVKHDITRVKNKLKSKVPDFSQGGFFAIKEVIKMVLPEEYQALHELKELLKERNLSLNI